MLRNCANGSGRFSLPCVTLISGQDTYDSLASKGIVKSVCVKVEDNIFKMMFFATVR